MDDVIYFYSANREYGYFSCFSKHPIDVNGKTWPTAEHYFQAQKFAGTLHEEIVRCAASSMEAAVVGRERFRPLRPDWDEVKNEVMKEALLAKFTQHERLQDILLATGQREIVEHTKNDSYWGDGGDGSGLNMLGELLMQIREELWVRNGLGVMMRLNE